MENHMVQVEVNGVKLELDTRYARRIETLRVGTKVKVLKKGYGDSHTVYPGVIVGFEPFRARPTITVAYIENSYSGSKLEFVHLNSETKDVEVVAAHDDFALDRESILSWFDREKAKLEMQIEELNAKRAFFLNNFSSYWQAVEMPAATDA